MRKNQTPSGETKMMTSETNIFSFGEIADPVEKARAALRAVRQYQRDWQELGTDRVYKYFDDVEGDWLENFDEIEVHPSPESISVCAQKLAPADIPQRRPQN